MNLRRSIFAVTTLLFFVMEVSGQSRQASAKPIAYKQPDGTTVTIILKGDQNIHWAETLDGYSLIVNNKTKGWEYAKPGCGDKMLPSGRLAHEPADRDAKEQKYLGRIPKSLHYSDKQIEIMLKKKKQT